MRITATAPRSPCGGASWPSGMRFRAGGHDESRDRYHD
jgi:hypothetical protein